MGHLVRIGKSDKTETKQGAVSQLVDLQEEALLSCTGLFCLVLFCSLSFF